MTLGPSSASVKRLRKLAERASFRHEQGAFVVEGPRAVEAALRASAELEGVFHSSALAAEWKAVLDLATSAAVPVYEVEVGALRSALSAESPQGLAAVARMPEAETRAPLPEGIAVVLDEVRDPGNAGTILRSAHASGASSVVFLPGSVDPYNPKTVRSSAGSIFFVECRRADSKQEFARLAIESGHRLVGTSAEAGASCFDSDLTGTLALVVGNEGAGISAEMASHIDEWVRVPIVASLESLNVAVATSVLLFESLRQRGGA